MKIPELKLNEIYYVFAFGYGGKYMKFYTQFLPQIPFKDKYFAKCDKNRDYTKSFIEHDDLFKCFISLDEFNKSIVIHETEFHKYKHIIRIPSLNLSRKQTEIYKRQILLDNLIND